MNKHLGLTEYQTLPEVELSQEQADLLRRLAPSVSVQQSYVTQGTYDLTPGSTVGGVQLGDLTIQIMPKIPIDRLMFILSYAMDPRTWMDTQLAMSSDTSVFEAVIPSFVFHLKTALRRGVLQSYRVVEDALNTVQGRIRFDEQSRKRFGIFPPIEVRYDDFTEDIEENRVLRAALHRLGLMRVRSLTARQSLRRFEALLGNISLVEYDPRSLPDIIYTRLNEHYRSAVELAKWILKCSSPELTVGNLAGSAFLVNMNVAFENFVLVALREALHLSPGSFPQGARGKGLKLDLRNRIGLEPDISWWESGRCVFVGDIKYKKITVEGMKNPDIYQLLAYTVATELPSGLLIYAAGEEEPVEHEVVNIGKVLEVMTLDLSRSPEEILSRVATVAARIRDLRSNALAAA